MGYRIQGTQPEGANFWKISLKIGITTTSKVDDIHMSWSKQNHIVIVGVYSSWKCDNFTLLQRHILNRLYRTYQHPHRYESISNWACCPACRTSLIATRFWVVVICPIIKCLTVLEFSFILFDLCLLITIFNFILNYVPIVTFWIFTYHKIWILLIVFCFIWNYWILYFLTCLEVFWSVVS